MKTGEKAKYLVEKFGKKVALQCVDEIIEAIKNYMGASALIDYGVEVYEQVKKEIEKL